MYQEIFSLLAVIYVYYIDIFACCLKVFKLNFLNRLHNFILFYRSIYLWVLYFRSSLLEIEVRGCCRQHCLSWLAPCHPSLFQELPLKCTCMGLCLSPSSFLMYCSTALLLTFICLFSSSFKPLLRTRLNIIRFKVFVLTVSKQKQTSVLNLKYNNV